MAAPIAGIVGLGVNNRPLVPFLLARGYRLAIFDRRPESILRQELGPGIPDAAIDWQTGADYCDRLVRYPHLDVVYLTPGMPKHGPPIQQLRARGVRVTCETQLFLEQCPAPVIAITGSQGKTTTTSLVGAALRQSQRKPVWVGGNIGRPLLPELAHIAPDSWVVLELSSFQLELVTVSPQGAVWLNLSPNHLDIHGSFEAYRAAKANIIRHQTANDWAVVPVDDPAIEPVLAGYRGQLWRFAIDQPVARGAFSLNGRLWWRPEGDREPQAVMARHEIPLLGRHNEANVLAALAAVMLAGGDATSFRTAVKTFAGVPHRLEWIGQVAGVDYINDSIATAPARTLAALKALTRPLVVILGGYDKQLDYDELGRGLAASSARAVVVLGQTAPKIVQAVRRHTQLPICPAESFDSAVYLAAQLAQPGDIVLLSPASASYDMFQNFEERGQRFRQLVDELKRRTASTGPS